MLQQLPPVAFSPWTPSRKGVSLGPPEFKMSQRPVLSSSFSGVEGDVWVYISVR